MDERLLSICLSHGVFLRSEAADLGYDDKSVAAAVRSRSWHRVRRGAYVLMPLWAESTLSQRHLIHCKAVLRSLGDNVALSHVSAVVARGIATWGLDLSRVHVTRLDGGSGRAESDVVHHEGVAIDTDTEPHGGLTVMKASRAVIETLTGCDIEQGLVIVDSALHQGILQPEEMLNTFQLMQRWPGIRTVQVVVRLADGHAESPGESRVRYICWARGLPAPHLQFAVRDEYGALIGITDFAWPEQRLLGEFDGRVKYGRLLLPGQAPGDVVFAEKVREDLLRETTGFGVVRLTWSDLDDHAAVARRVARMMRRTD
ncbi:MAG: type IV toxin-antitoxin system AbiEi family antitoxin domain-containing protein [Nocardioidaceae bacterium]